MWRQAIAAIGDDVEPVLPAEGVRARLLASLEASRWDRFAGQVAELFAVTVEGARDVLAKLDDAAAWRTLMPGIDCIRVSGSSNPMQAQCAFVRVAPGTTFPWHRHVGEERSLVLHGGAHMADGRDLRPGDVLVVDESVEHDFVVEGDDACIFAVKSSGMIPGPKPR
jgi:quercetin dioxygenase-like cupin family protein